MMFLPKEARKKILGIASFVQALPDIFFIFVIQTGVILLYERTHFLLVNVVGGFDRAYSIPIIILSILPTLLLFRVMVHIFQDEQEEEYVLFALSKGLRQHSVITIHIFRNALVRVINHFNSVFWLMISNLVMLEYVFNIQGIIYFIIDRPYFHVVAFGLLCLYIPFYLILLVIKLWVRRWTTKEVAL